MIEFRDALTDLLDEFGTDDFGKFDALTDLLDDFGTSDGLTDLHEVGIATSDLVTRPRTLRMNSEPKAWAGYVAIHSHFGLMCNTPQLFDVSRL